MSRRGGALVRVPVIVEPGRRRDIGILGDREPGGALRHRCTATVGRVFFAPVRRAPACRGHGAVNAPVRPAAPHAVRGFTGG
ncbi:hypothetical protein TUE45_07202 [Streptomyces reticuli]|nr:hypothetical protein TUE45_07202 [Streptomyces reticuli]